MNPALSIINIHLDTGLRVRILSAHGTRDQEGGAIGSHVDVSAVRVDVASAQVRRAHLPQVQISLLERQEGAEVGVTSFTGFCKTLLLDPDPQSDHSRTLAWVVVICMAVVFSVLAWEALFA